MLLPRTRKRGVSLMECLAAISIWATVALFVSQWMYFDQLSRRHEFAERSSLTCAMNASALLDATAWSELTSKHADVVAQIARQQLPADEPWEVTISIVDLAPPIEASTDFEIATKPLLSKRITVTVTRQEQLPLSVSLSTFRHAVGEEDAS